MHLLHIVRDERKQHTSVDQAVGRTATSLSSLKVARSRATISRGIVHHSSASDVLRSTQLLVIVVSALSHTVVEARARWLEWRGSGRTVLVAEEVLNVLAGEIEVVVHAVNFAVGEGDGVGWRGQDGEGAGVVLGCAVGGGPGCGGD